MNDKRPALGRGLGALIPTSAQGEHRPADVFFGRAPAPGAHASGITDISLDETAIVERITGDDTHGVARSDELAGRHREPGLSGSSPAPGFDPHAPASGRPDSVPDPRVSEDGLRAVPGLTFAELPLAAIRPNPRQPRTVFDEDELAELVSSIGQIGILQPIVVRPLEPPAPTSDGEPVRFELVVGERRWRAAAQAGLDHVPAIIKATADDELLRDALLENLHRSQLNPLEEAAAYQQLLDDFGCTQDELATRVGRSRPQVSNTLRLLRLPAIVQRRVAAGVLSAGHARALLGLSDAAAMERLAQRIVAEGLSVRSVEEIVALGLDSGSPARRPARHTTPDAQLEDLAARMADAFDTQVRVALGRRKGRVTIDFASVDDLHRILERMGVEAS